MAPVDIISADDGHRSMASVRRAQNYNEADEDNYCSGLLHCWSAVVAAFKVGQRRSGGDLEDVHSSEESREERVLLQTGKGQDAGPVGTSFVVKPLR